MAFDEGPARFRCAHSCWLDQRPNGGIPQNFKEDILELLGNSADVVNRKTLKPLMRDNILHDAVDAF
jgi:hypothetical protein